MDQVLETIVMMGHKSNNGERGREIWVELWGFVSGSRDHDSRDAR